MSMLDWTVEEEVHLFNSLSGLRPVGLNKHFYMACIMERLSKRLKRDLNTKAIWEHLRTMYNLDALDEVEPLPFSNDESEFFLPENEFGSQMSKKCVESESTSYDDTAVSSNNSTSTSLLTEQSTKPFASTPLPKERKDLNKTLEQPKRSQKRTRGSTSLESNSPSTTPPPTLNSKRRRI